ncbi:branched-chain amino acid transport system ATP-binding protein [Rhodoligotrophos appendicifer]|uniref:ABC transporter ATP-binding protein n=1 Tax=Rhodoligotrophos appendicifer TaxID=987056 RepID=UPI00117FAFC3|nr:ABC transporter ATP-binding protein [Rhodoligotrophos appendicifer]
MKAASLGCHDVAVRFGSFQALSGVSLNFLAGKTTALIGPNGAGKTTLLNVLAGLQKATTGTVTMDGQDISNLPPYGRARAGIARSFQIVNVFPQMTVFENLRLTLQRRHMRFSVPWRTVASYSALSEEAARRLALFGLDRLRDELAGSLSHGQQRALELALTLGTDPQVLLLDEPLAGVGQTELPKFTRLISEIVAGRTTLLVEHNMDVVMAMADEIIVLVGGSVLARGSAETIRADPRVRDAYLGH